MQTDKSSIILLSKDAALEVGLRASLEAGGDCAVTVQPQSLAQVNGAAVEMARGHDLMLFHLTDADDLEAVKALRLKIGRERSIVAVTEADLPLARALELKSHGIDEILPYPLPDDVLRRQVSELLARDRTNRLPAVVGEGPAPIAGQIVAVVPVRGGIGATTLAINLADHLQARTGFMRKVARNRVALVDLDLQFGSIGSALDVVPSETLFRMASEGLVPDRTLLSQSMVSHASGISVLTAPPDFVPLDAIRREQIDALLVALQQDFDYVIVDLPRSLTDWIAPVVNRASSILMVTDSTVPSIRQAYRLVEFYKGERYEPPISMVVNFEKKPMFTAAHHAEAAKVLGRPLKHWIPPDPKSARLALDRGVPLAEAARGSAMNKAIRAIATSLRDAEAARRTNDSNKRARG